MVMILLGLGILIRIQPIRIVVIIVLLTLGYILVIFNQLMRIWFSYLVMLVMLRGVIVVFTYMASITPNEKFEIRWVAVCILMIVGGRLWWIEGEFTFGSLIIWDRSFLIINLLILVFLLCIMVMVVWVRNWWKGPVRV